ncbi:MAG: hypothetical protein COZ46_06450 [Verrucomicrobia bacterium CG_4_10_14_3_um_filter_43_23]|nr:MAG: hypothetical protein AUJ82_00335 [Verrucomicrobia bacterium CG1_02_43_26]PIP59278.1 MAG: hypothetical protein COX01_04600 [Verrucomicrobia bacterium CG22_combo_CG10-13_8_21_14_all_43_17]PIX57934.1 MAG: hypothetical protein COZ46_06450 [Verrucomicrobia bacterium CG_4_10_14_3_um_filter_43_23]PIY61738.1 MAG: hypothetical protein COY94_03955 [Verrucomicrobia bacterium CG_4_10_14_0_8_um_filter_43_34]PJA43441.1 MAG: hypothetical protein CO175_08045 [Verrucomicrobia bacterium CG_4_9_14_3_um_fi
MDQERILCVTVYIINEKNEFLFLHHKKLGKWLPAGGKVEPTETPDESLHREVFEETGLEINLIGEGDTPVDGGLAKPWGVQLNRVSPIRDHVDLVYVGVPKKSNAQPILNEREAFAIEWVSVDKIDAIDTFPSVRQWVQLIDDSGVLGAAF